MDSVDIRRDAFAFIVEFANISWMIVNVIAFSNFLLGKRMKDARLLSYALIRSH